MPKSKKNQEKANQTTIVAIVAIIVLIFLAVMMAFYFINASRQMRMGIKPPSVPSIVKPHLSKQAVPVTRPVPRPVAAPVVRPVGGVASPVRRMERRTIYNNNNP